MKWLRITELCRELRNNETASEERLWNILSGRTFSDYKFRRQHPFIYSTIQFKKSFFIADFYCASKKIIIELDGKIHDFQKDYDANRDAILGQLGLKTIRIKNEELDKDIAVVLKKIENALKR